MSDFAWIIFIIVVYLIVIRPMMQGILKKEPSVPNEKKAPKKSTENKVNEDYVDYEEIK